MFDNQTIERLLSMRPDLSSLTKKEIRECYTKQTRHQQHISYQTNDHVFWDDDAYLKAMSALSFLIDAVEEKSTTIDGKPLDDFMELDLSTLNTTKDILEVIEPDNNILQCPTPNESTPNNFSLDDPLNTFPPTMKLPPQLSTIFLSLSKQDNINPLIAKFNQSINHSISYFSDLVQTQPTENLKKYLPSIISTPSSNINKNSEMINNDNDLDMNLDFASVNLKFDSILDSNSINFNSTDKENHIEYNNRQDDNTPSHQKLTEFMNYNNEEREEFNKSKQKVRCQEPPEINLFEIDQIVQDPGSVDISSFVSNITQTNNFEEKDAFEQNCNTTNLIESYCENRFIETPMILESPTNIFSPPLRVSFDPLHIDKEGDLTPVYSAFSVPLETSPNLHTDDDSNSENLKEMNFLTFTPIQIENNIEMSSIAPEDVTLPDKIYSSIDSEYENDEQEIIWDASCGQFSEEPSFVRLFKRIPYPLIATKQGILYKYTNFPIGINSAIYSSSKHNISNHPSKLSFDWHRLFFCLQPPFLFYYTLPLQSSKTTTNNSPIQYEGCIWLKSIEQIKKSETKRKLSNSHWQVKDENNNKTLNYISFNSERNEELAQDIALDDWGYSFDLIFKEHLQLHHVKLCTPNENEFNDWFSYLYEGINKSNTHSHNSAKHPFSTAKIITKPGKTVTKTQDNTTAISCTTTSDSFNISKTEKPSLLSSPLFYFYNGYLNNRLGSFYYDEFSLEAHQSPGENTSNSWAKEIARAFYTFLFPDTDLDNPRFSEPYSIPPMKTFKADFGNECLSKSEYDNGPIDIENCDEENYIIINHLDVPTIQIENNSFYKDSCPSLSRSEYLKRLNYDKLLKRQAYFSSMCGIKL